MDVWKSERARERKFVYVGGLLTGDGRLVTVGLRTTVCVLYKFYINIHIYACDYGDVPAVCMVSLRGRGFQ